MMARRIKIYFDGGCRPNPGKMETAVVTGGAATVVRDAGIGSSMDAEWLALIAALRLAQNLGLKNFVLLGDAAAVVAQANGAVPARGGRWTIFPRFARSSAMARCRAYVISSARRIWRESRWRGGDSAAAGC